MRKFFGLGALFALGAMLASGPAWSQPVTPMPASMGPGPSDVCLKCHAKEAPIQAFLHGPHAIRSDKRTPLAGAGCQTCHGDSLKHIASRQNAPDVNFPEPAGNVTNVFKGPNISPTSTRVEQCLQCHENGERMNWKGSVHDNGGKACNDCHTIHVTKDPILVRFTQAEKCFSCHPRQRADSYKYSHHPMREGKVVCTDCHNPHGSIGDTKSLKEFTVNEVCYNCHADKRGPLLWEHQPVRDNCLNCHTPHGSNEPRLMKTRMNFLCSSCHSAASNNSGGAFGGGHSIPMRGPGGVFFNSALANQRQCVNCHSQVHGSNSPSGAFFFR